MSKSILQFTSDIKQSYLVSNYVSVMERNLFIESFYDKYDVISYLRQVSFEADESSRERQAKREPIITSQTRHKLCQSPFKEYW